MPVVPSPIVLSDGARLDQAFNRELLNYTVGTQSYRINLPSGYEILLLSLAFAYLSGAVAGNRVMFIVATDSNGMSIWQLSAPQSQNANKNVTYYAGIDVGITSVTDIINTVTLPEIPIPRGGSILVSASAGFGGDQITPSTAYATWVPVMSEDENTAIAQQPIADVQLLA